jgi:hypothetical protein
MHTVAEIKEEILKLKPEEIYQLGKRVQELLKELPKQSRNAAVKTRQPK